MSAWNIKPCTCGRVGSRPIKHWHTLIARCLAVCFALLLITQAHALDQVSLQLKWKHQFQFAGYYAAIEQGFYRESGLEVEIREGGPAVDANATMAAGSADFGICTNSPLLNKDQRANGHFTSRDLFALRCDYSDAGSLRYPQDISRIG